MNDYKLISTETGQEIDEETSVTTDPETGAPLEVVYDYESIRKRLNSYVLESTPISTRKYLDLFPIRDYANVVSLQEGNTPLYESAKLKKKLGLRKLFFKYEGANPTGSFKDRGSLVELTKAVELGAEVVTLASTGNMAASVSAFSAKAGLDCYIFIPEGTAPGKLAQSLSFGAKVIQIHGDYNTAADLAEKVSEEYDFFLAGDYAFRHEGQKTQAYEIVEQMLFRVPDYVLVPVGNGINISAIWKGFVEYKKLGVIDKLPRMVAVQSSEVAPIVKRYKKDLSDFEVIKNPQTVSTAIAVGDPLYGEMVMSLLEESDGIAVSVTDEETLEAQHELATEESIFVEPGGATVMAALNKLAEAGHVDEDASYVALLSGNGLKDPYAPLRILAEPPTIDPVIDEVDKLLQSQILQLRSYGAREREEILFSEVPKTAKLQDIIKNKLSIELEDKYLSTVLYQIQEFLKKGKKVNKADLQYIIENAIQIYIPEEKRVLKVKDFEIIINLGKAPKAIVTASVADEVIEVESTGTGPVDAAIKALQKACAKNSKYDINLTDYVVNINTSGTDTAVDVEMKLERVNGDKVSTVGHGTSPDIIQASIDAFVNGYNELVVNN